MLQVTANCDVQLYNDPTMPGCSEGPDGVECADKSVEACTSAIELQITTTDASVHITRRFEVPIFDTVGSGRRALQRVGDAGSASRAARKARVEEKSAEVFALVDMFRTDQQAGLAFPTEVIEFNCDTDAHAGRPICQQHGRRRLQGQACPHATFLDREQEMQSNCGVTVGDTTVLRSPSCPSAVCAGVLISLLEAGSNR